MNLSILLTAMAIAAIALPTAHAAEVERHSVQRWLDGQRIEIERSITEAGDFKERVCLTKPGSGKECAQTDTKVQGAELQCLMVSMKREEVRDGELLRAAPIAERMPAHSSVTPCGAMPQPSLQTSEARMP